jgi:hypothetical protein
MQCVIRWIFRAKTMGFCFGVVAAGAVVFAVVLFFADSLKQPTGWDFSNHSGPDYWYKTNLYACWVFPRRNSGERRLALAVADGLG